MPQLSMKLLIVVNVDWFFCSHRLPVAVEALRRGYEVHVATTFTNANYKETLLSQGFILHDLSIDRSGKSFLGFVRSFFDLYRVFRCVGPDIVHLVTIQPVLLGGLAAKMAGVKCFVFAVSGLGHVFVGNSLMTRVRRLLVKLLYRFSFWVKYRSVIFQNHVDMQRLASFCSLSSDECFLLPGSGVDLSLFSYQPLPAGQPIVLMASRLLATKGVREFVDAAFILKLRGIRARFQLVGEPDFSNPAAIQLHELDSWRDQGLVEILGHRSDIHDIMSNSHIVCLPSYYPEGLPKVLCEAAACGRVVVTTDEPGCRDAIQNGSTGLLVPSRDSIALAECLSHLVTNPDLIHTMGIAGRKRAEEVFDVHYIVEKHLNIYSRLLFNT